MSKEDCVMSGKRYLLDTNAVIALLNGHSVVSSLVHSADYIAISVISRLEFLSFSDITEQDKALFDRFASRVDVIDLSMVNLALLDEVCLVRSQSKLKLPDAIVAASAKMAQATLVTADQRLADYATGWCICFDPAG